MTITIIFPTFNRSGLLIEALRSLVPQCHNRGVDSIEILVIDNNSSDDTSVKVESFAKEFPDLDIRYVLEKTQGLSSARNRGLREAKGNLIAFADDDIEFDQGWLEACIAAFRDIPESGIIGGPVLPFKSSLPSWLPRSRETLVGIWSYIGAKTEVKNVIGCNCCFRREVVSVVGEFNEKLGRNGKILLMGEENEYFSRARNMGYRIFAVPDMIVFHKVQTKFRLDYVLQNSISSGAGLATYDRIEHGSLFRFLKKIYYSYLLIYSLGSRQLVSGEKTIELNITINFIKGYLRGVRIFGDHIS